MLKNNDKIRMLLNIVAIVLLFLAVTDNLHDDDILSWFVCLFALYNAYIFYGNNTTELTLIFTVIAIIFNPVIPIYFSHDLRTLLQVMAGAVFTYPLLK